MKSRSFKITEPSQADKIAKILREQVESGKVISVTIEPWVKRRSLASNAYLHGVVLKMIAEEVGDSIEGVKLDLKVLFGPRVESKLRPGKMIPKSTADYSSPEMIGFIDDCIRFASAELNMMIPEPGVYEAA